MSAQPARTRQTDRSLSAEGGAPAAQAIKDCLWAFATLSHVPPASFLAAAEQHCTRTLGDFTSQNVANAIWAFQKLGHLPQLELLQLVDDQVRQQGSLGAGLRVH